MSLQIVRQIDLYILVFLVTMSFCACLLCVFSCDIVPAFSCKLLGAGTVLLFARHNLCYRSLYLIYRKLMSGNQYKIHWCKLKQTLAHCVHEKIPAFFALNITVEEFPNIMVVFTLPGKYDPRQWKLQEVKQ